MQAQIWELKTDYEGESTIKLKVPASELVEVIKLNTMLKKVVELEIKEK